MCFIAIIYLAVELLLHIHTEIINKSALYVPILCGPVADVCVLISEYLGSLLQ